MPLEGLQLGHYRLLRLIGSGGMGEVYLAEDPRLHRQVAIKVIRGEATSYPGALASKEAARLFLREARAIAMLDHPHILPLYDYGEEIVDRAEYTYLVMPFRQEGSLAHWLSQRTSPLTQEDVGSLINQVAGALQYAHDHSIIHQDVKPSNFLIRSNLDNPGRPDLLLTDFGVAKLTSVTSSVSHNVRGTPTYMAPEQWAGDPVPATDQYALAVMAYELLVGRPPFQGAPMRMMYLHANAQPELPSMLNPRLPREVDAVLLRSLAKHPQDRFPSVAAFAQVLQQALQSTDVPTFVKVPYMPKSAGIQETLLRPDPGSIDRRLPGSNQDIPAYAAVTPQFSGGEVYVKHQGATRGKNTLLIVLALIIVLASIGLISFIGINQIVTNNTNAIATTQARDATTFAARGTAQANNATATVGAIATATTVANTNANATVIAANPNPYPPFNGTLALYDPLKDNSGGYSWDQNSDSGGTCTFTGGAFYVSAPISPRYHGCAAKNTDFSNFAFEVKMKIIAGDCGAIFFRGNIAIFHYYFFRICQKGSYDLLFYDSSGQATRSFASSFSPAINAGLGQSNIIAAVAINDSITVYVNHQVITRVIDSNYTEGQIGVFADNDRNSTEVMFNDAKVWKL